MNAINKFKKKLKILKRKVFQSPHPPTLFQIEITNYCNLKCPMCPRNKMTRKVEYMEFTLFKKIVDELEKINPRNGGEKFRLHHFGESILHPRIKEFITYAEKKGMKTALSTNANFLTPNKHSDILANLSTLFVSFDGYAKKTYEKHRVNGNYERTKENLIALLKVKKNFHKPEIIISTLVTPDTQPELQKYEDFWLKKGADKVRLKTVHDWNGQKDIAKSIGYKQKISNALCTLFSDYFVVLVDGRVVPCCKDYDGECILGDLNKQTISEVWHSKRYRELRKKHLNGKKNEIKLCSKCSNYPELKIS
ncbi:MAG: radical SAM protein [archaeon]|nr:radical SAM protein [archaeon]